MNALPAVALKNDRYVETRKVSKAKKGKVLKFVAKKRSDFLSALEQEQMILDHRLKARSLAHSILRRWHSRLDGEEVESIVDLSLCEAVKRFKRSKGATFITFLFYHLRGNLIRGVSEAANLNFVPLPDFDVSDATPEGNKGKVLTAMEAADSVTNYDIATPDELLLKKEVASLSSQACEKLDPLEREVIHRIYVLEEQLMDIASSLGYSRCHISRVKRKALETLHKDLSNTVFQGEEVGSPLFEDGEETPRASGKLVRRRKPRSKKAKMVQIRAHAA
jgi:RNA polymerase sigma factor (sigma-70 family)